MLDSGSAALGIPALDLAVISVLYDAGLTPDRNHRKTVDVLRLIADAGLCGIEDGYRVLQRLSATWLMPLPLVDSHGNFGSLRDPPAPPMFTEVRLASAGVMAVEAHRGDLPLLPVGLINGDLPLVLGLDFGLWPVDEEDRPSSGPHLRGRPGFGPAGLVGALSSVAERRRTTSAELATIVGPPWLGPFEPVSGEWRQLYETGVQSVWLTPRRGEEVEDWALPAAEVMLDLGAPLFELLWEWMANAGHRAPNPAVLHQLVNTSHAPERRDMVVRVLRAEDSRFHDPGQPPDLGLLVIWQPPQGSKVVQGTHHCCPSVRQSVVRCERREDRGQRLQLAPIAPLLDQLTQRAVHLVHLGIFPHGHPRSPGSWRSAGRRPRSLRSTPGKAPTVGSAGGRWQVTAEQFIRWNGRRFVRDPSGRHSFRAVERGQWSPWVTDGKGRIARRDPEGARTLLEHGTPVPEYATPYAGSAKAAAPPRRDRREERVDALGKSGVANALEVIGVLGIIVSVIAGIAIVADASSYDYYSSGPDASLGWFVGIAGTVQSLLLLGFAKVLVFTKATAMLLAENLDEVRAG